MSLAFDNLLESKQFVNYLFDNLSTAILLIDKKLQVYKINNSYKTLFQKDEVEVLNQLCGNSLGCSFAVEENKLCGSTSKCSNCTLRKYINIGFTDKDQIQSTYITRKFYINNKPIYKYFRIKIKYLKYNNIDMAIISIDDVTELEEQKKQIEDMANKDFLTKLHNRRYLYDSGEKIFQNAKRGSINLAVVMIDIDYFKKINDTYGHNAGDFILLSLSDMLTSNLRQADIITRFGGEEFCILLNVKKTDDAFHVIEKVRKSVENQNFYYEKIKIKISISCGICITMGNSLEQMIQSADSMLYKAKENGRNKTFVYQK